MIKQIKIYSRLQMQNFIRNNGIGFPFENWDLISINDGEPLITEYANRVLEGIGCNKILSLRFADMVPEHTVQGAILFDEKHAMKVVRFINKAHQNIKDTTLVVHCYAGISRSGAVGTFACDYCGLDYLDFMAKNLRIQANPHVLRTLRKVSHMTPDFGTHNGIDPTCDILFWPLINEEPKKENQ